MANVCFGCRDVEDVRKCKDHECFAYEYRSENLTMDVEHTKKINLMVFEERTRLNLR
jgi:hypothetical protein